MKIYTKTGDQGETGILGGRRVSKTDLRIIAFGDVDELNALLGMCRVHNKDDVLEKILHRLQRELFELGADLSTPLEEKYKVPRISPEQTVNLEKDIDFLDQKLEPLKNFILPAGGSVGSFLHLARTVCRRAERAIVALTSQEKMNPAILPYINRLSDLLFVMARFANKIDEIEEEKWDRRRLH